MTDILNEKVQHPKHYTALPVEAIEVTKHFNFCLGNVIKYIWRASDKGKELEDLKKAKWYLEYWIDELEKKNGD